jgi:hypothetical protein
VTEDTQIVVIDAPERHREYVDLVPAGYRANFDL